MDLTGHDLEGIGQALGLRGMEDTEGWHQVTGYQLKTLLHEPFNKVFGMHIWDALELAFPDKEWRVWKFNGLHKDDSSTFMFECLLCPYY